MKESYGDPDVKKHKHKWHSVRTCKNPGCSNCGMGIDDCVICHVIKPSDYERVLAYLNEDTYIITANAKNMWDAIQVKELEEPYRFALLGRKKLLRKIEILKAKIENLEDEFCGDWNR